MAVAAITAVRSEAVRAAVLTISSSKTAAAGDDESGPRLERLARELGASSVSYEVIADDRAAIEQRLRHWTQAGCALVLTTGGTGLAPDDVTPEATLAVLDRQAPGIAEAMRLASRAHTHHWMLSRAVAGVSEKTLIVNFPGSPSAIAQVAAELQPSLRHALELLDGTATPHDPRA
jgi:molybdenum cofactor synthesis domain-containing protein